MTYLGENVKKLGFGLMRLPKTGKDFDIEQIKIMVDEFLNAGFTYFDTAWVYPGSENVIRKALVERYPRESFQLATKLAPWVNCKNKEDAINQFETSLKQTGAGYLDFYLLHNLGGDRTKYFDDFDLWDFAQQKKSEGIIKHVGFSFHSTPEELEEILILHPEMEFVQLQINYADWNSASVQSRACYEIARKYNKPIIVMEPVKGGMLATPPECVEKIFKAENPDASNASWAIRFAAGLDGIITVLSGMSTIQQMKDNISFMKDFKFLSENEKSVLQNARMAFESISLIPCTSCNYCAKVCPENIGISGLFSAMNHYTLYNKKDETAEQAMKIIKEQNKNSVDKCIKCGKCEKACPQHISIRDELERTENELLS